MHHANQDPAITGYGSSGGNIEPETPYTQFEHDPHDTIEDILRDPAYLPSREQLLTLLGQVTNRITASAELENEYGGPTCEIWNREYIQAFAVYIAGKAEVFGATVATPATLLDPCAGDGRLSHYVGEELTRLVPGRVRVIATDSGDAGIEPLFPVQIMGYEEAVRTHRPKMVICSWMPSGKDFTAAFRAASGVDEYILIGESGGPGAMCGDEWLTWGYSESNLVPPYQQDGFELTYLEELSCLQTSRIGFQMSPRFDTSCTASFRRVPTT